MNNAALAPLASEDIWQRLQGEAALLPYADSSVLLCEAVIDEQQPKEARWRVAMLLGQLGGRAAIEALLAARHDPQIEIRQSAIWALGDISDPSAFDALSIIFADPDEEEQLRFVTGSALARMDAARALPLLQNALNSESDAQRRAARAVLTNIAEREQR
jgi:HEAT repeat protein